MKARAPEKVAPDVHKTYQVTRDYIRSGKRTLPPGVLDAAIRTAWILRGMVRA